MYHKKDLEEEGTLKIIAITGPIASGKTVLSKRLSKVLRYPVWSADACVHDLISQNKDVQQKILSLFPEVKGSNTGGVEKDILRESALKSVESLKKLEGVLHPYVDTLCRAFIQKSRQDKLKGVILEIPLLFEVGFEKEVDLIILVESPAFYQKKRFLRRTHMTLEKAKIFESRLIPFSEKRKKAHIIIKNGRSFRFSHSKIVKRPKI